MYFVRYVTSPYMVKAVTYLSKNTSKQLILYTLESSVSNVWVAIEPSVTSEVLQLTLKTVLHLRM